MTRRTFFSFHYKPDSWRASQIRNMGIIEGNKPVSDNDWETITEGGDDEIQKWIDDQIRGKSCTIVLIGAKTAGRKWIKYEIKKSWNDNKGLLGIYIHNLEDSDEKQTTKGKNPFSDFTMERDDSKLSSIVEAHNPPYAVSKKVYNYIKENIETWVEDAITIRNEY